MRNSSLTDLALTLLNEEEKKSENKGYDEIAKPVQFEKIKRTICKTLLLLNDDLFNGISLFVAH